MSICRVNIVFKHNSGPQKMADQVNFTPGCQNSDTKCSNYSSEDVKTALVDRDIQLIIICLGTGK